MQMTHHIRGATWRATLLVGITAALVASCRDSVSTPQPMLAAKFAVQPGSDDNAPGFFWLPPMVATPGAFTGTFDATRSPVVKIVCTGATGGTCPTLATLTGSSAGINKVVVDAATQSYKTQWLAPSTLALGTGKYAIEVYDGALRIGRADLQLVVTTREAANVPPTNIAVIRGKTLSIRFRIEQVRSSTVLPGPIDALAVTAYPLQQPVPSASTFRTGHPSMPTMPLSISDALVIISSRATVGQINAALAITQAEILGGVPGVPNTVDGSLVLRFPTTSHAAMDARLALLKAQPGILGAIANMGLSSLVTTAAPSGAGTETWEWLSRLDGGNLGLKYMAVPQMWNLNDWVGKTGSLIETGIIDVGYFPHEDVIPHSDVSGGLQDTHGTHVAGIIGARFNNGIGIDGVTPFALMRFDVTTFELAFLCTYLPAHIIAHPRERVVNLSLGWEWSKRGIDAKNSTEARLKADFGGTAYRNALASLAVPLPVIVSAAGNDSDAPTSVQPAELLSPMNNASLVHGVAAIIVVEAVGRSNRRTKFTGVGGHIAAPGDSVLSATQSASYEVLSGTSMAAPHIAGLISYLYSIDPLLPRPTMTTNPMRDLLLANPIAVELSPVPSVNAFQAALDIDRVRGNDVVLRALLDIDDGSADGNLRVNAFGQTMVGTDFDGNGRKGDGAIDMSDFRTFRDHMLDVVSFSSPNMLNGAPTHPKRDLNGDGSVNGSGETLYPRADFNGDGNLSLTRTARMSGALNNQTLTDLAVLQSRFVDRYYTANDLPGLVQSADVTFDLTQCFALTGAQFVRLSTASHTRVVPATEQVTVVTVPSSASGVTFNVIVLDVQQSTEIGRETVGAPAELGQDTFVTPCAARVTVSPATVTGQRNTPIQLTATVSGLSNTDVTWTTTGGSVTPSGRFTASTAGLYTVTARSVASPSVSGSATVQISATPATFSVNQVEATIHTNPQRFRARITNDPSIRVEFSALTFDTQFIPGVDRRIPVTVTATPAPTIDGANTDWFVFVSFPTNVIALNRSSSVLTVGYNVRACYFRADGTPIVFASTGQPCQSLSTPMFFHPKP